MAERKPMAVIKLARGQVGYYDELSRIHLTIGNPTATVYTGTNVAQIRRSISSGRLILVSGSLGKEVKPFKIIEHNGKYIIASNVEEEMKPLEEKETVESKEAVKVIKTEEAKEEKEPAEAKEEALKTEDNSSDEDKNDNKTKSKGKKKTAKASEEDAKVEEDK